jgi:acetyltransferase-like isoleucine patch superfamily enzyme
MLPIEQLIERYERLRNLLFTLLISNQFKAIGRGSRIEPPFRCSHLRQIVLEEKVTIQRDGWIQTIPGHGDEQSAKLTIKSHAAIGMGAHISAARQVIIGEYVLLARNVYISDHAHAFADVTIPIMRQGIDSIAPVLIGRETWLGQNVVVLPGVTIGQHCVIGANSVVNSAIPDFSVAVGAPARVVKQYNKSTGRWERLK